MVEKRWTELFIMMTQDENSKVRDYDHLKGMDVFEFFMALSIFQSNIKKRTDKAEELKAKRKS